MAVFRSIVFIAALAGLVAGLAMTGMQYAGTVPLILKAETFETDAPAHDHGAAAPPTARPPTSTRMEAGRPRTISSGPPIPRLATS